MIVCLTQDTKQKYWIAERVQPGTTLGKPEFSAGRTPEAPEHQEIATVNESPSYHPLNASPSNIRL
jgi:hypothetical protein